MKVGEHFNPRGLLTGAFVPNAVMRMAGLPASAKLCYARLLQCAGPDGVAHWEPWALASDVGIDRRTGVAALRRLEERGLIAKASADMPGRIPHRNNRCRFLWHPAFGGHRPDTESDR